MKPKKIRSRHFSPTAFRCHCGCLFGAAAADIDPALIPALDALQERLPFRILITSACRCPRENARVKGEPDSTHLAGQAVDVVPVIEGGNRSDRTAARQNIFVEAAKIPAFFKGGIGYLKYREHVHLDVRPDGPARW